MMADRDALVQLGDELRDDAIHDAAAVRAFAPHRRERVQLVEEHHAGRGEASALEHLTHVPLGLAHVHVHELGALHGEETQRALRGDGFGEERLPRPRRAVQQRTASTAQTTRLREWFREWFREFGFGFGV